MRFDRATTARILSAALDFKGHAHLPRIAAPALILVADSDPWTQAKGNVMRAHIPESQLQMIDRSLHLLSMDNPRAFNRAVLTFLGGHGS